MTKFQQLYIHNINRTISRDNHKCFEMKRSLVFMYFLCSKCDRANTQNLEEKLIKKESGRVGDKERIYCTNTYPLEDFMPIDWLILFYSTPSRHDDFVTFLKRENALYQNTFSRNNFHGATYIFSFNNCYNFIEIL